MAVAGKLPGMNTHHQHHIDRSDAATAASASALARLERHFHGAARVQLKPLAGALGIAERALRNLNNELRIGEMTVLPLRINGRWTYDLLEVARALGMAEVAAARSQATEAEAPPPASAVRPRGRPRKAGLTVGGIFCGGAA